MAKPLTQADVDRWADRLREDGYPYIGPREHNYWQLLPDGRIHSIWTNDDGVFETTEDDVISTIEEIDESVYCWIYDC